MWNPRSNLGGVGRLGYYDRVVTLDNFWGRPPSKPKKG